MTSAATSRPLVSVPSGWRASGWDALYAVGRCLRAVPYNRPDRDILGVRRFEIPARDRRVSRSVEDPRKHLHAGWSNGDYGGGAGKELREDGDEQQHSENRYANLDATAVRQRSRDADRMCHEGHARKGTRGSRGDTTTRAKSDASYMRTPQATLRARSPLTSSDPRYVRPLS